MLVKKNRLTLEERSRCFESEYVEARKVTGLRANLSAVFIPWGLSYCLCKETPEILQSLCRLWYTGTEHSLLGFLRSSLPVSPWGAGSCEISVPGHFSEHKPRPSLGVWQHYSQMAFTKQERQNSWLRPIRDSPPGWALCSGVGSVDPLSMAASVLLRKQLLQCRENSGYFPSARRQCFFIFKKAVHIIKQ